MESKRERLPDSITAEYKLSKHPKLIEMTTFPIRIGSERKSLVIHESKEIDQVQVPVKKFPNGAIKPLSALIQGVLNRNDLDLGHFLVWCKNNHGIPAILTKHVSKIRQESEPYAPEQLILLGCYAFLEKKNAEAKNYFQKLIEAKEAKESATLCLNQLFNNTLGNSSSTLASIDYASGMANLQKQSTAFCRSGITHPVCYTDLYTIQARKGLKAAALQSHALAQYELAAHLINHAWTLKFGQGSEAKSLLKQAAVNGLGDAYWRLADYEEKPLQKAKCYANALRSFKVLDIYLTTNKVKADLYNLYQAHPSEEILEIAGEFLTDIYPSIKEKFFNRIGQFHKTLNNNGFAPELTANILSFFVPTKLHSHDPSWNLQDLAGRIRDGIQEVRLSERTGDMQETLERIEQLELDALREHRGAALIVSYITSATNRKGWSDRLINILDHALERNRLSLTL